MQRPVKRAQVNEAKWARTDRVQYIWKRNCGDTEGIAALRFTMKAIREPDDAPVRMLGGWSGEFEGREDAA